MAVITLLVIFPATVVAQESHPAPKNEFGLWGGYSFNSPHVFGISSDRQLGVLAFRYGRTLLDTPNVSLEYTLDIFPVEVMRQPAFIGCAVISNGVVLSGFCPNGRESVYGGGISPIGWKANFFRKCRFQPFGAVSVGFISSARPIPEDIRGGTQFNFTFDFQAGFQYFNAQRTRSWMFGYKLEHISNAYRSNVNPGVDANLFFFGYSFYK